MGFATKLFVFTLILSFSFNLWANTTVGSTGSGSVTYNETVGQNAENIQNSIPKNILDYALSSIVANAPAVALTVTGLLSGNYLVAFAGFAATFLSSVAVPTAALNESFGNSFGTLFSLIISFLYTVSIISWWKGNYDTP